MSKISSLLLAGALLTASISNAQDFTILENPFELSTTGCTPFLDEPFETKDFVIGFQTHLKNISTDPADSIIVEWTYLHDLTIQPAGWKLIGICDNDLCRSEDDVWYTGTPQFGMKFNNTQDMLLELNVYAPSNGPNGTGTYHVQVKTPNQTDTAVFILTKNPVGISTVLVTDNNIKLYPNPASNVLNIYNDNDLKIKEISVYNIIGKEITKQNRIDNQEVLALELDHFPSGIYMIRFNDESGHTIATRKFTKK